MVTSAKSSVPTVTDQAAAMQLGQCAKNLATCLAELRTSAQKVGTINGSSHLLLAATLMVFFFRRARVSNGGVDIFVAPNLRLSPFISQAHEACGPMEIDSALTAIQTLRSGLQDAKMAAVNAQLKPLPGESVSGAYFSWKLCSPLSH